MVEFWKKIKLKILQFPGKKGGRMNEKRRYHRMKIEIPMSFWVPPDEKNVSTSTLDIGGTGVSFVTPEEVKARQELLMYLFLPEEGKTEIHAKVVRVEKAGTQNKVAVRIIDPIKFDEKKFISFYAARLKEVFGKKGS